MNATDPLTEDEVNALHEEDNAIQDAQEQLDDEMTNPAYDFLPYNIFHDDGFGSGFGDDDDF